MIMLYLTSKFHDNRVNTFGFMEGGGAIEAPPQAQELQKSPGGIGLINFMGIYNCNLFVSAEIPEVV